jgi:hypothetical protein
MMQTPVIHLVRILIAPIAFTLLTACRSASFQNTDLRPILLLPDDLPAVLNAGSNSSLEYDESFNYDVAHQQAIVTSSGETAGETRVYLFHSTEDRDRMFDYLSLMETQEGILPYQTPAIGEKILTRQASTRQGGIQIDLTFQRCYAVAHIWLRTTNDFAVQGSDIIAYAQQLDMRLQKVACP